MYNPVNAQVNDKINENNAATAMLSQDQRSTLRICDSKMLSQDQRSTAMLSQENKIDKINMIMNKIIDWYKNYEFQTSIARHKPKKLTDKLREKKRERKIKSRNLISYTRQFQSQLPGYFDIWLQGIKVLIQIINQYCRDYYPITHYNLMDTYSTNQLKMFCPFCFTRYKKNGEPYANAINVEHIIDGVIFEVSIFNRTLKISDGDIILMKNFNHKMEAMETAKLSRIYY